ncbi:MAG TPA: TolC family protein [Candidatus Baltobacteraceae bacterium]
MVHFLAFVIAMAVAPAPAPTPAPTATPTGTATPSASPTGDQLILPVVPDVGASIPPVLSASAAPPSDIAGVNQTPFVGLSIENAVAMALSRNSDVIVAQENRRIAQYRAVAAAGAYDVRLQIEPDYTFNAQPVTNAFFAGPGAQPVQNGEFGTTGGFTGQTLSGTQYSLTANASHTTNTTTINGFDPTYGTFFALNLSQPLLRGAGFDDTRRQLELSRVNAQISSDQLLITASDTITSVLDTYYDLIAAWRNVAIQEDAYRQAKAQSQSNTRLVKAGAAAPVDVAESDAQVYIFEDNVFSALQNVAHLQNQLKALTLLDPADPLWNANIVPVSAPSAVGEEPPLGDLLAAAFVHRPELDSVRQSAHSADIELAYARGQIRPQFDLHLGVQENGFAGDQVNPAQNPLNALLPPGVTFPSPPAYETGKLGQAWTNAFDGRFPQYTLGATISFPLANRFGRGTLGAAAEQERSVVAQQAAVITRIEIEARNAIQSYRSARARLAAATAERQATQRVFEGEERKFNSGQSTTFLVLQREVSLANARGTELQSATDLQKALVELDRVSGAIFAHYHIDVSSVGTAPVSFGAPIGAAK